MAITAVLIASSLISLTFVIISAMHGATVASIRTPWPLLAPGTLIAIAILWASALIGAMYIRSRTTNLLQGMLALFGTLSLAPIIYKIGYGFDGFLHWAGEEVILQTGILNPKPFYYIGQYVFTTWLARISEISVWQIDRWFLPILVSILLPACAVMTFRHKPDFMGMIAWLVLLPLGAFVATTPQGLALVLGLAAIILAIGVHNKEINPTAPIMLGLWSAMTHPLAGIPALGLAIAIMLSDGKTWRVVSSIILAALSGISIPILFFMLSRSGGLNIEWNLEPIIQIQTWLQIGTRIFPYLANKFTLWPAWASLVLISLPAIGLIGSIYTAIKIERYRKIASLILICSVMLFVSSGLLKQTGDFTALIQYEKGDYAERLFNFSVMLLLVGCLPALGLLWDKARKAMPIASLIAIILFALVGAANAYDALPRHDAVQASRGWSTGLDDVEAVRWIDQYAKNKNYTVLANQSVSAAAVKEFGFKRYAKNDVFFYPIPTGGPLYQTYLKMTYEDPSIDTIKDAARLGQTNLVFVVINDYWWKATELNESIGQISNAQWTSDDNKVNVYAFELEKNVQP